MGTTGLLTKKIRVCHVVSILDTGGMENGVVNLCNGHDRSIIDPMICCLKMPGAMAERLRPDVKLVCLHLPEGRAPFRPWLLARFFRKERPDIVHTHGWGGGAWDGVVGARLARCPVVINGEHGTLFTGWHQIALQRLVARCCDGIFSVSPALKDKVVETLHIPASKITVVTNGVDLERFSGDHQRAVLPPIDAAGREITVLCCIGTLKAHKNQLMAVKAIQALSRSGHGSQLKLLLVGDGPDRDLLADYVRQEGLSDSVRLLGNRTDIPQILAQSDILISSSRSEAFSNVVLEAMASGLPVISTRSVGTEDIVADGLSGFLVDVDDVAALADKIRILAGDRCLASEFGAKGREIVMQKYSIKRMVCDYEKEYVRLYTRAV